MPYTFHAARWRLADDTEGVPVERGTGEHPHSSHWGAFLARVEDGRVRVRAHPDDPDPAPLLSNIEAAADSAARVTSPAFRRGWLKNGPGADSSRGADAFVEVPWDEALDICAGELERVYRDHGAEAVYGGSYGWSSAGRVHHAQSQVHRFLNGMGGYVRSVNTYSAGAAEVILPRVLAPYEALVTDSVAWSDIEKHGRLVVAFGGMPERTRYVQSGGPSRHRAGAALRATQQAGVEFVLVSPLRDDVPDHLEATWLAPRPTTDVALMLGIAHTLVVEGLHDRAFLDRCCTGYPIFERYLLGLDDGQPKDAAWAAGISGVPEEAITGLARRMAAGPTLITVAHGLQRAEHGEQPVWMAITLAAMLGGIGSPGAGFAYALGIFANIGQAPLTVSIPSFPQGRNPIGTFIPVARIADMLLHPGEAFDYDGQQLTYPAIRLVYWAGGNPFHHHQDLGRLRRAFRRPDTIIVHEPYWTATARHADIVLPSTITLEREDIGSSRNDPGVIAMHRVLEPHGQARDDWAIFAALADRLGHGPAFTEGRDIESWLRHVYAGLAKALADAGGKAPTFEEFWESGELTLPVADEVGGWLRRFREDPEANSLATPSGRIEIYSETIAGFEYEDCPGHPAWLPADEWLGSGRAAEYPLQLIANQPAGRLHSQLDFGAASRERKIEGREVARLNPVDASARGIASGDTVRLFNDRGACFAAAAVDVAVLPGCVQLPTGAWFDPLDAGDPPTCLAGNPNTVTRDKGTSSLAQGCTGQLTLVEVERATGAPATRGHGAPDTADHPS
jgi:biotin/methionine sulfoxide reductase